MSVALRRLVRERSNFFFVLLFPLLMVLLIGSQFGGGQSTVVAVVDEATATLLSDLDGVDTTVVGDGIAVRDAVRDGEADAGLVTDEDGPARWVTPPNASPIGTRTRVLGLLAAEHDAERVAAGLVSLGATDAAAVDAAISATSGVPATTVTSRAVGEAEEDVFAGLGQFDLGASSQLLLFVFITALTGSAAVVQARQWGILDRALVSPVAVWQVVGGLALGQLVVALSQGVIIVVGTAALFDVSWGDPVATGAVVVAFSFVAAFAGLLLGSLFTNDQQVGGVAVPLALGLAAVGGSMMPLELFGDTMTTISRFTPHAWGNLAFAEIVRRGGGVGDVLGELGALAAFAIVLGVTSLLVARRRLISAGR